MDVIETAHQAGGCIQSLTVDKFHRHPNRSTKSQPRQSFALLRLSLNVIFISISSFKHSFDKYEIKLISCLDPLINISLLLENIELHLNKLPYNMKTM